MAFVDEIKNEGVELERRAMGPGSAPAGPMVIEVDHADPEKDIDALDIELPRLPLAAIDPYLSVKRTGRAS